MGVYLGIDVGTGSVRAGLFDAAGRALGMGVQAIQLWKPAPDLAEQSTRDIWEACATAVREALRAAGLSGDAVAGIGFDATCSLVVAGRGGAPLAVSPNGPSDRNVIVWMDHRATDQAARINATRHDVLRYVGGEVSPEMQTPKLLWLKEHHPATWKQAAHFFDLPDWLAWRATGEDVRSLCTTVCKWTYLGHEKSDDAPSIGRWAPDYFHAVGLGELAEENFRRIGTRVRPMGERQGVLTEDAARELGLVAGIPVGVSIIDAHAGGLGVLGATLDGKAPAREDLDRRLALIGGTSTCHMGVSMEPRFIKGIWGPYYSAMVPGMWLTEGGQSASGALVDYIIRSHARGVEVEKQASREGTTVYTLLNRELERLSASEPFPACVAQGLHVDPDFHGNRSPFADPHLRGTIAGLSLDDSVAALARLYLATIQSLAYGTRTIIESMNAAGYRIDTLMLTGGGANNPVFVREHADATGCRVVLAREGAAVLLGAALLGAVAAGDFSDIPAAMAAMNHAGSIIEPASGDTRAFHDRKHAIQRQMHRDQLVWRDMMSGEYTAL